MSVTINWENLERNNLENGKTCDSFILALRNLATICSPKYFFTHGTRYLTEGHDNTKGTSRN
jgi:hypothetical protein